MLVVESYFFSPGCCAFCHSSNLPTIDTGQDMDRNNSPDDDNPSAINRVYICADCAINFASLTLYSRGLELVNSDLFAEMRRTIASLSENNLEKQISIEKLEMALTVVREVNAPPRARPQKTEAMIPVEKAQFKTVAPVPSHGKSGA